MGIDGVNPYFEAVLGGHALGRGSTLPGEAEAVLAGILLGQVEYSGDHSDWDQSRHKDVAGACDFLPHNPSLHKGRIDFKLSGREREVRPSCRYLLVQPISNDTEDVTIIFFQRH
jgi:hypothetical protein